MRLQGCGKADVGGLYQGAGDSLWIRRLCRTFLQTLRVRDLKHALRLRAKKNPRKLAPCSDRGYKILQNRLNLPPSKGLN